MMTMFILSVKNTIHRAMADMRKVNGLPIVTNVVERSLLSFFIDGLWSCINCFDRVPGLL